MNNNEYFSYSRINTFQNCKELYRINYIDKIRKKNENIEAYLGSCVHKVIEDIYTEKIDSINLDDIIYMYDKIWKDRWHDNIYLIDRSRKLSQYYNLGIECLRNFYKKNIQSKPDFLNNVIHSELDLRFSIDGINFRGIIDRLDFNSITNEYTVNDYKTSKRIISSKKAKKDLQLGLYVIAVQHKFKTKDPINLKWHFLRYGIDVFVNSNTIELESIKKNLVNKANKILELSKESDNFNPNETMLCNWCHYWEECTAKITSNPAKRILNAG